MQRYTNVFNLENVITPSTGLAAWIGVFVGPTIEIFYGGGRDIFIIVLIAVIIGDWISGIAAAHKDDTYSSEYGRAGILRTIFLLWFPVIGNLLDQMIHSPGVLFYAITVGLIYHTFNSMTANTYRAGWDKWIPKKLVRFVSSEIRAKSERAMRKKGEELL